MRDLIFAAVLLPLLPVCFRRPFVGLAVFSWLAYMRPQDLTWGFARGMRWSYYVAIIMFAGYFANRKTKFFLPNLRCYVMILLLILVGLGILASGRPSTYLFNRYMEFVKIIAIALFTTGIVQNKERLRVLLWIIALSLGFYGVKSGLWGILSGGNLQILQGPGGMLADNNDFSLALSMAVPMLFHLGWTERRKPIRRAFFFSLPLTVITVGLTRSRGGFLSVTAGIGVLMWRSRNRVLGIVLGVVGLTVGLLLAPGDYTERLRTITTPTEEGSAASRLRAWGIASRMAMDNPVFGVGFGRFPHRYLEYCTDPTKGELDGTAIIVAHSSYFQIWAEAGTPAMSLYLLLIGMSFMTVWRVRRRARDRYYTSWMINYATMFEASLVAFVVGSAFLNRAHFDLFYHWVALVLVFERVAFQEMEDEEKYPVRVGGRGPIHHVRSPGFQPRRRSSGFAPPALPGRA